jgi:hypothetical protein
MDQKELVSWIQERNLSGFAALCLEAGKPFHVLLAQGFYLLDPLLQPWIKPAELGSLLEDAQRMDSVIAELREEERN